MTGPDYGARTSFSMPVSLSWLAEPMVFKSEAIFRGSPAAPASRQRRPPREAPHGASPGKHPPPKSHIKRQHRVRSDRGESIPRAPGARLSSRHPYESVRMRRRALKPPHPGRCAAMASAATTASYRAGFILERRNTASTQNRGGALRGLAAHVGRSGVSATG